MPDTDTQNWPPQAEPVPYPGTQAGVMQPPLQADKPRSLDDMANYDKIVAADTDLMKQKIGAEGGMAAAMQKREQAYDTRMNRMIAAEGATMDDIKPWNASEEMAKQKTDLWSQFGSPGFVIGMLASAFTAMPMYSALNAGAAAMNAIDEGSMERYNKSFDAWKQNTDLVIKRIDLEKDEFSQIDKLRERDMASWRAQMESMLTRFDDKRKLALLQGGLDSEVIQAFDAQARAREDLADAQQRIEQNNTSRQLTMALLGDKKDPQSIVQAKRDADFIMSHPNTPEGMVVANVISDPGFRSLPSAEQNARITDAVTRLYQGRYGARSAGAAEKAKTEEEIKADIRKEHPEWTPGQIDLETNKRIKQSQAAAVTGNKVMDAEAHIGQYDMAMDIVDRVTAVLDKYAGSAGVAGRATRLGERVGNILGSNQTDRTQMMRDIEELQLMAPRLLLDQRTGRPLSTEAAHVSDIIAGLNLGDTTANTLRAMKEVKERLQVFRDRNAADLQRATGADGATHERPSTPSSSDWSDFPAVQ